jgi:hypothetical protein
VLELVAPLPRTKRLLELVIRFGCQAGRGSVLPVTAPGAVGEMLDLARRVGGE